MQRKAVYRFFAVIVFYIIIRFPVGLLEDWFMGEILNQVESVGISFLFVWGLPLLIAISLVAVISWTWDYIASIRLKASNKYQPSTSSVAMTVKTYCPTITTGYRSDIGFKTSTNNNKNRVLEARVPIQAVTFKKPAEKIIRPEMLPVIIECENNTFRRLMNSLLLIANPRIRVKEFTEKGIVWDDENTIGVDIDLEFTPKRCED